jgi:signal transduction histidine kinase
LSNGDHAVLLEIIRRLEDRLELEKRAREAAEQLMLEQVADADAARRAAEAASRAKSDFLAVTSHEVRTPLNAVLGLTEALKNEPLSERQASLVDGVLDAGAMLMRLLNSVLDLTRIETGQMPLEIEPLDLRRCAETVVEIWRPRAAERAVTLTLKMDAVPGEHGLLLDRSKIEQVLVNFISNALKFTPVGGRIDVRLIALDQGETNIRVRLEVSDQGPGVPAADSERIFQPFEQTPVGREAGGAGLGLSICAGHAALLGGAIGVEAAAGGGALFWLEVPAEFAAIEHVTADPPPPPAPLAPEPESLMSSPVGDPSALRVLAAEDHPANRLVLQALLEPVGAAVTFVENGQDAIDAVAGSGFDLVLMDVNMPVMDGVTALRAIRALGGPISQTPVHMVTANVFEEDVRRYMEAGADGVVKKPIDVRELYALVARTAASRAGPPPGEGQGVVDRIARDAS